MILAETSQKIDINKLMKETKNSLKEALVTSRLEAEGISIKLLKSRTGFGGERYWFSCPVCQRRVGVLYKHPISQILGCRKCLGLDYRKHRYSKMMESKL